MSEKTEIVEIDQNRRDFMKKAAYTAPAIVTMAAVPSFASAGSGYRQSDNIRPAPLSRGRRNGGPREHRERRRRS